VVDIIHRELGITMEQVTKKGGGSHVLSGPSKEDACRIEMQEREEVGRRAHGRV